jgi:hypothetical protein
MLFFLSFCESLAYTAGYLKRRKEGRKEVRAAQKSRGRCGRPTISARKEGRVEGSLHGLRASRGCRCRGRGWRDLLKKREQGKAGRQESKRRKGGKKKRKVS